MKDNELNTNNKLNTPYRTNAEYAKKRANKTNTNEYDYEFGQENESRYDYEFGQENESRYDNEFGQDNESRYDYEFGEEANISAKDSPLARGANISNAFSYPAAGAAETASDQGNYGRYAEEYALGQPDNASLQRQVNANGLKKKYQENLRQNYNVEFSDDELIEDNCDCCENCSKCQK